MTEPKTLLAQALADAITELPYTWLDYLELEDVVSRVGAAGIRCAWLMDGSVQLWGTDTGECLGHFRVNVSVEEVTP